MEGGSDDAKKEEQENTITISQGSVGESIMGEIN